ncbi:MAG: chemotaxis protein CheW [Geminicoccaceae bacterium]
MTDAIMSEIDQEALTQGQNEAMSPTSQTWSQYLTFMIDDSSYGIEITKVREIKGWSAPTELPNGPHAMRGVLNLRGVIVPIFDLRARFGQGETQPSGEHVVIIVSLGDRLIGVLVDAVSDILTMEPVEILPMPELDSGVDQRFLSGLVSQDDQLVALLRLEELFDIQDTSTDEAF